MLHTCRGRGFDCLLTLISISPPAPPSVSYTVWYKQGPGGLGIKGQFHDYYYYLFFYLSTPPAQFIHRRKWFGLRLTFHKYILFQSSNISTNPFTPMCRFSDTFFECLCTQATLLIIIRFHSYLRSREVYCISFLGKKKN